MTEEPKRKAFLSSSNTAEKMIELARQFPQYKNQLRQYADDMAVEAYVLGPTEELFQKMVQELAYCGRMYKAVTGRELRAD